MIGTGYDDIIDRLFRKRPPPRRCAAEAQPSRNRCCRYRVGTPEIKGTEAMEYVNLKGARVPALGLGTWQLSGAQCADIVRAGLALGYRHIDTAQAYNNEEE